jgi:hypothetical protein
MRLRLVLTVFASLLPGLVAAQPASPAPAAPAAPAAAPTKPAAPSATPAAPAAPHVYSDTGNIFIEKNGVKTQLTSSEQDIRPALSPDGSYVVYTRQGRGRSVRGYDLGQFCVDTPKPDELRRVNVDGTGDRMLLEGRKGEAQQQLCDFRSKQFSADGTRLYFLTPGWTTSGALHVYDLRTHEQHFLQPANDLLVLNFCPGQYKDDLVVQSHRYFVFGGSYDWYWLFDPSGKKELGPIGVFPGPVAMAKAAHADWCKK